ncbi:Holliday junction resolvase RuvX [Clostridiaceae bacterium HSG29]|nr:Holliday junction resolvase RuvX [Clostridiaceae bacterium HSG29]
MKILGLDVGDKTIGIAVSDALLITAQGRKTIFRKSNKETIDEIVDIIVEDEIDKIVVGFPKNMNNTVGPQAIKTENFMKKVSKKIKYTTRINWEIEIIYFDERLSSKSAERVLLQGDVSRRNRKKVIDKLAAVFILQNYLDSL